jgi:hypothetical protein
MTGQEQQQAAAERLIAVDRSSWQRHRRLQLGAVCLPPPSRDGRNVQRDRNQNLGAINRGKQQWPNLGNHVAARKLQTVLDLFASRGKDSQLKYSTAVSFSQREKVAALRSFRCSPLLLVVDAGHRWRPYNDRHHMAAR